MAYLVCAQCGRSMCGSCVALFQEVLKQRVINKTGGRTFLLYDCLTKFVHDAPPPGAILPMYGCNACKFAEVDLLTTEFIPDADLDITSTYATGGAEIDGQKQKDYELDNDDCSPAATMPDVSPAATMPDVLDRDSAEASKCKQAGMKRQRNGNGRQTKRAGKELELAARFFNHWQQDQRLDGALIVQDLLLPCVTNYTWCHAIGNQANGEPGLRHAAMPLPVAAAITKEEYENAIKFRSTEDGPVIYKVQHMIEDSNGLSRVVVVQWMYYEQVKNLPLIVNGQSPNKDFVLKTTPVQLPLQEVDVDIVCVAMGSSTAQGEAHLVAALHKPSSGAFPSDFNFARVGDELLTDLLPRAGVRGLEVSRSGGALGRCDPKSNDFKAFMKRRGKIPRVGKAAVVVVINSPSRCGAMFTYYQETKEKGKCVVSFWYNTPRAGGNQTLLDRQIRKHRVLQKFPLCRVVTAMLCLQLNKLNLFPRPVIATASRNLLDLFSLACQKAEAHAKDPMLGDPLFWMAKASKHTLVMHPVGWHIDIFADNGKDCIENKLCLVSWDRTDFSRTDLALGRGGLGPGGFVFGLLDWDAPVRHRRHVFLVNGGNPKQRVTQSRMETFLSNQPAVVVEQLTQEAADEGIDLVAGCTTSTR